MGILPAQAESGAQKFGGTQALGRNRGLQGAGVTGTRSGDRAEYVFATASRSCGFSALVSKTRLPAPKLCSSIARPGQRARRKSCSICSLRTRAISPGRALVPSAFRPEGKRKARRAPGAKGASGSGTRGVLDEEARALVFEPNSASIAGANSCAVRGERMRTDNSITPPPQTPSAPPKPQFLEVSYFSLPNRQSYDLLLMDLWQKLHNFRLIFDE